MKVLPQVLFWLGLHFCPVPHGWYGTFGSQIEIIRPVLASINDPALRAALQEAHAERLGIWVAVWPVSFLVMSSRSLKRKCRDKKHLRYCRQSLFLDWKLEWAVRFRTVIWR